MPLTQDPALVTVLARLKRLADAEYVRDAILTTIARARRDPVQGERLEEAKSHGRYAFARTLDNSESIAGTLAAFVRVRRSYDTLNALYRRYDALTPDDLQAAAARYLSDESMVLTTLSREPLASSVATPPSLETFAPPRASGGAPREFLLQRSPSPLLRMKLLFAAGSAHDPTGREGLAQLAASMIADAGSAQMRIDEINRALFPMAGSFDAQVDREMTVFTGVVHRDNADRFADIVAQTTAGPWAARGRLRAPEGEAAQRARPGPACQQRGRAREGAPADEHLCGQPVRAHHARHRRRDRGDHARRRAHLRRADVHARVTQRRARRRRAGGLRGAAASGAGVAARRRRTRGVGRAGTAAPRPRDRDHREGDASRRDLARASDRSYTPRTRTSPRSGWRALGSASIASRTAACSSASVRSAA